MQPYTHTNRESYDNYANIWANKMQSGQNVAHRYLEKPAMYSKLPDLRGKKVLCIGCASAEECQYLSELGAQVVGIDLSPELIKIARLNFPELNVQVMDMENLTFAENEFDYVYSSLTLHYSPNWAQILNEVSRVLKRDGVFLFSTHHPIKWASASKYTKKQNSFLMGYVKNKETNQAEIYGDYLNSREIKETLFGQMQISFFHKPLSEIFKIIRESDFELLDFLEPKTIPEAKKEKPSFYAVHDKIPLFMIFELENKKV